MSHMTVQRVSSDSLAVAKFADGSMAICDAKTQNVYSLNATAAAAWEACGNPAAILRVAACMSASLGHEVTEATARDALAQLQEQGLLRTPLPFRSTRRTAIARAAGIAAPVIMALTGAEQQAFAIDAGSVPVTTTTTTTPVPSSRPSR